MVWHSKTVTDETCGTACARAGSFWGITPDTAYGGEGLTLEKLNARFAEPPSNAAFHYTPTAFSFEGDFVFLPNAWDARWPALEATFDAFEPNATLSLLPITLQIDPFVLNTFRKKGVLGTTTIPGNTPLAVEIMRQLGVQVLIATPMTAQRFLVDASPASVLPIHAWHIIVGPAEARSIFSLPGVAVKDFHLMPGISVAWQCSSLGASNVFHPSPSFAWHVDEDTVRITSIDDRPAPLYRFRACKGRLEHAECACGEHMKLTVL
jgi:hypothetical protein